LTPRVDEWPRSPIERVPMTLRVRRRDAHRRMPWQNGGGITYEVARAPDAAESSEFTWRISMAEVAGAGPFSALPGVDRIIVLIDGQWMALTVDGERQVLEREQPLSFSGDSRVACEVPGASRDLNVMTRRGRATATLEIVPPSTGRRVEPGGADLVVLVCVDGTVHIDTDTEAAGLETYDAALCTGAGPVTVSGPGTVAAARIRLLGGGERLGLG
jgi:uncharacterized protein